MKLSKKSLALVVGLTLSVSGTAFAADGADGFSDVPQGHWAYDAIDYLAKDGVIDGMGDGTFQGNRTMTRYEMASIVAKAMQKGGLGIGDQAVLDKLSSEFGGEIATLKKQVGQNTKDIKDLKAKVDRLQIHGMFRAQMGRDNGLMKYVTNESDAANENNYNLGRNGDYNNRFYMDLEGSMKINDHATARFTIEKNARYRDSEARRLVRVTGNGTNKGEVIAILPSAAHMGNDTAEYDSTHNGTVSNLWAELQLGPKHDWYTNIGRKWNGIGMQNLMLGGVVDGVATYHPIEHGRGWWFSGQYYEGASNWHEEGGVDNDALDSKFTASLATYNKNKITGTEPDYNCGDPTNANWYSWVQGNKYSQLSNSDKLDLVVNHTKNITGRAPVMAVVNFWGPLGKYIDANLAYGWVVQHDDAFYMQANKAFGIDLKVKPFKDFSVTTSLVKTNAKANYVAPQPHMDRDLAVRMDYRGTDLNKKGSWGLWAKWQELGAFGDFGHDDEWSTREPTYTSGAKGWLMGFNVVPAKNVEWGGLWGVMRENFGTAGGDFWNGSRDFKRNILRTWLDFHF